MLWRKLDLSYESVVVLATIKETSPSLLSQKHSLCMEKVYSDSKKVMLSFQTKYVRFEEPRAKKNWIKRVYVYKYCIQNCINWRWYVNPKLMQKLYNTELSTKINARKFILRKL